MNIYSELSLYPVSGTDSQQKLVCTVICLEAVRARWSSSGQKSSLE
jgi:hypothetical protein